MPCRFPGPHPGGKLMGDLAGGVSRPTPRGSAPRGCLLPGGSAPGMATASGGTHPTGMHSCLLIDSYFKVQNFIK